MANEKEEDYDQLQEENEGPTEEEKAAKAPTKYAWIVLILITFIAMMNQWQRYAIAYANGYRGDQGDWRKGDPKDEIDTEYPDMSEWYGYGLLSGPAFAFSYAIMGVFAGVISDRVNRKMIMSVMAICWSVTTLGTGLIRNFWMLFVFRFMLGIFEAFLSPTAYSVIADYFHPESRSFANAVYNLGIYFGGALSSLSIILISNIGWANTFVWMGILGVGSGVVSFVFILEPERNKFDPKKKAAKIEEDEEEQEKPGAGAAFIASAKEICTNETCRYACIAASFRFFGGYAIGFFMPKYFGTVYKSYKDQYSIANAFVVSLMGMASSLSGGYFSDYYEKKGILMTKAYICVLSAVLGIPTIAMCCLVQNNFWFSMTSLGLEYLFAESWLSPCITMMMNTVAPENKGFAVSAFLFFATVAGTISTTLAGAIQSGMKTSEPGKEYLNGWILCFFVLFSYGGSIPFMLLAGKSYTKFMKEKALAEKREDLLEKHNQLIDESEN